MSTSAATIERSAEQTLPVRSPRAVAVAYVMSRFPTLTETFVLYEILAVERQGVQVEVYPLLRGKNTTTLSDGTSIWKKAAELFQKPHGDAVMHAEALDLAKRAHYQPFISWAIVMAQLYFLLRSPRRYLAALWAVVRGTWGSLNFFVGGLSIFPKCVYFAYRMKSDGVSHVHAHFANHPTLAAFVIHRLTGIPYSFTAHGSDIHRDQRMLREKVADASFVVPISHFNRELISRVCGGEFREKLKVIHCGVDTRVFQPVGRVRRSGTDRPFTILCIGKMHEVKGQMYLIEACRRLRNRGIRFCCQLVGDGPDRAQLSERIDAAGLTDHVQLLGLRTRDQVVELVRDADVVAAPSVPSRSGRREGIPVVLMEAMACGVAVVASDLTGIPELVEHGRCGLLVPPGDDAALADALASLHDDPQLRSRLGRGGRCKVLEEFDLEKNAAALAARFRQEGRL